MCEMRHVCQSTPHRKQTLVDADGHVLTNWGIIALGNKISVVQSKVEAWY